MPCNYKKNITKFRNHIKAALTTLEATRSPNKIRRLLGQLRADRDNGIMTKADYNCVRGLFIPQRPLKYDEFKEELDKHFEFKRGLREIKLKS